MIRVLDIFFSTIALAILSPMLVVISLILALTGEGKIFYRQNRVGLNGEMFGLLKFATMLENSPNLPGGDITRGNDPRVLPFGRFLRKTKINELPQLLNLFRGDISLIGPRPLTPGNFGFYDEKTQEVISSVKPGLSGVGSIVFRDEEAIICNSKKETLDFYREDIAPYKGELEKWFISRQNVFDYFRFIFLTAWVVLFSRSLLVWRVFPDLPIPPESLRELLCYPNS